MHRRLIAVLIALPTFACAHSTTPATQPTPAARARGSELVEFEMMTWPEVKQAIDAGKTTALFYTGGTEQRGPQNVNGGHTLMARATAGSTGGRWFPPAAPAHCHRAGSPGSGSRQRLHFGVDDHRRAGRQDEKQGQPGQHDQGQ